MKFTIATIATIVMSVLNMMSCAAQNGNVSMNQMDVSWLIENDSIIFEMSAPTNGWITIGFNEKSGLPGTYLLMGRVKKGMAELVEYHTLSPGNYVTLESLGSNNDVSSVEGYETDSMTVIKFKIPVKSDSDYDKSFSSGRKFNMLFAYSVSDDFDHHSIMRTSVKIEL